MYARREVDRQDLFQDMLLQVWRSYPSFRGESAPSTWMYRVALNTALLQQRSARRRPDLMGVGVMMIAWDCATYRANPVWVWVMGGMSLLLVGFIAFGLRVLHDMHQLDDTMDSVAGLVQRQLHFFRTRYQFWLAMVAAGIWVLSFAVSLQMYHDAGQYRVTVDGFLMVFSVLQAVIIYGLVRGSHHLFSRRLVAALEDLNAQATERTDRIERGHRGLKVLLVVAVVAGILLFAGVLLRFLHP